jgi:hypothetical protein
MAGPRTQALVLGTVHLANAPDGFKPESLQPLLDKLVSLKADRLVTQTRASHKQLKVGDEDYRRQIEYELADGTRHKLYMGVAAGYQATHVRAEGRTTFIWLQVCRPDAPAQPSGWVPATLAVPGPNWWPDGGERNGTLEFSDLLECGR